MKASSLLLAIPVLTLVACEGDSDSLSVRESDFYDRTVITVAGQNYAVVTRPATASFPQRYYVQLDGRFFECDAPTVEACAPVINRATSSEDP
ncbi:hypothetical protein [Nioella nitratireducens]|uniref:hypothetical protein n=1 Tax=Nioella nitratireducens TaxID=1287720 RepID=UPI0008FD8389|nr:hypothetical protein [Nioella nitratireducens]